MRKASDLRVARGKLRQNPAKKDSEGRPKDQENPRHHAESVPLESETERERIVERHGQASERQCEDKAGYDHTRSDFRFVWGGRASSPESGGHEKDREDTESPKGG